MSSFTFAATADMPAHTVPRDMVWCLRFKMGKSTLFVQTHPLHPLSQLRADLLGVLQEVAQNGKFEGRIVPTDPNDINLGLLVDQFDLSKGIIDIDAAGEPKPSTATSKGKGKVKSTEDLVLECPKNVGMRPDSIVIFRFKNAQDHNLGAASQESGQSLGDAEDDEVEPWDVTLPSMEDTYGDEEDAVEGD